MLADLRANWGLYLMVGCAALAFGTVMAWAVGHLVWVVFIEPGRHRRIENAIWRRHLAEQQAQQLGLPPPKEPTWLTIEDQRLRDRKPRRRR